VNNDNSTNNVLFIAVAVSAYFIRPFYKMMLGKPLALNDMESVVSMPLCSSEDGYVVNALLKNVVCDRYFVLANYCWRHAS